MSDLDRCDEVRKLAAAMGVSGSDGIVAGLLACCRSRVGRWVAELGGVGSIDDVERIVCEKLGLAIEEAWTDADLGRICGRYVLHGEPVFGCLWDLLDAETYAVLVRCRSSNGVGGKRYVAVIDCRGEKKNRRFFSRWHEIAHMMMLPPSVASPVHRSGRGESKIERLMDMIAADIGFFEPVFAPVLAAEVRSAGGLSFAGVERVRRVYCARASYEATLRACVERLDKAVMLLEVGFGCGGGSGRGFSADANWGEESRCELRVRRSVSNAAARGVGIVVRRNCRVPCGSVLRDCVFGEEGWQWAKERELIERSDLWRATGLVWPGKTLRMAVVNWRDRVVAMVFEGDEADI